MANVIPKEPTMIIDCETHIFRRNFDYRGCRVEDLLEDMNRCDVDRSFLTFYCDSTLTSPCGEITDPSVKRFGDSDEEVWEYFRESWRKHQASFYFFSVPDPREPDCIERLEEQCELGLHGIGETQPATQNILPNGPEFMRVYRFAADRALPVVLTMERWEECLCFRGRYFNEFFGMFEQVIREFKDVRFMIGHGGDCGSILSKDWDAYLASNLRCYELAAELDNVWVCSCMPWWFVGNKVHPLLERQLRFLRDHVGFSKVTWGSDWPYNGSSKSFSFRSDYGTVVDYYRNLPFCSAEERQYLLGGAAHEFVTGYRAESGS